MSIEQKTITRGGLTAEIEIDYDQDVECPNDWDEAIQVFSASYAKQFWDQARSEFSNAETAVDKLSRGVEMQTGDAYYLGIERYSHGADAYALCGMGNFPDRRWDVSPIVGWVKIDRKQAKDNKWGPAGRRKAAAAKLEEWTAWCNGWVYYYDTSVKDESGEEIEGSSCGGFYDIDHCMDEATAEAEAMLESYVQSIKEAACSL
jgi:hypothetical protein